MPRRADGSCTSPSRASWTTTSTTREYLLSLDLTVLSLVFHDLVFPLLAVVLVVRTQDIHVLLLLITCS